MNCLTNNHRNTPYITGVCVSAKTREELKSSRYSEAEYIKAAKSIASYTICFALSEAHMAVEQMVSKLRGHRLCTFRCYGPALRQLEAYDRMRWSSMKVVNGEDQKRLDVMFPFIHEDMEDNLTRMYYTALNWYCRYKHPEAKILAAAQVAQIVNDFACNIIEARVTEIRRMDATWASDMVNLKPTKINKMIVNIMHDIVKATVDCGPDADINQCRELHYGIKCMEEIVSDVDQMELYTAYGIEQTKGAEYLKTECPSAYYKLHPMEDPVWLAEKEARALAEMEADEEARAEKLMYTTAEIEKKEAKEGMTLEEMFAGKGWKVDTAR